jgi:drug/metabolite transporter (DMT)-like permease
MDPAVLAGISAACFAGSHIASKRGARTTSVVAGLLISLATGWLVLGVATLLDPPSDVPVAGVAILAGGGLVAPAIGRAANITGIDRLGPAISVSIQTSVYPMFAVTGAFLVRGELPTVTRAVGTLAIVLGVVLLARQTGAADEHARSLTAVSTAPARPGPAAPAPSRVRARTVSAAIIFPMIAGAAYGSGDLIRKEGIGLLPHPTFAAFLAVSAALLAWSLATVVVPSVRGRIRVGDGAAWFVAGGILTSTAILVQFHAFRRGDVSLVSPIVAAQPLFILVLSAFLLRGLERVTPPVVLGALATVAGVLLVAR